MRQLRRDILVSVVSMGNGSLLVDLGRSAYGDVYALQQQLVAARHSGALRQDCFVLTEHSPVYTLGRRGGMQFLHLSDQARIEKGIDLVHIERGGEITYHGPGQLVLYPIVNLRTRKLRVAEYVGLLEEVMIQLAALFGVCATRNCKNPGVWLEDGSAKIGSVGIAIRHGISYHGLAINIDIDLEPFSWITPCGLSGVVATSLKEQGAVHCSLADARERLPDIVSGLFGEIRRISSCETVEQIVAMGS